MVFLIGWFVECIRDSRTLCVCYKMLFCVGCVTVMIGILFYELWFVAVGVCSGACAWGLVVLIPQICVK